MVLPETGKYVGLDIAGTAFRVLLIKLLGNRKQKIASKTYEIPRELVAASGEMVSDS